MIGKTKYNLFILVQITYFATLKIVVYFRLNEQITENQN